MNNIKSEILAVIDVVANEKRIPKVVVIEAIEKAFSKMASNYYSTNGQVIAEIDHQNGEIIMYEVIDNKKTILPPIPMQRMSASIMKNIILDHIRSAEKQLEYDEYKQKEGEVIVGVVKKATPFSIIVNIGATAEGIIFKDGMLKSDSYRAGDKVKACIKSVQRSDIECQIILSRTDNMFLYSLMYGMIAEIQDGIIEIKSIARDPGSKSKVAVFSTDGRLDPVGACIGTKGSRIKPVIDELHGERVDIVYWDRDLVMFAKNALTQVKCLHGEYKQEIGNIEIIVPDDELKIAIGRAGQNVRLASQLVGCNITVISESEKKEKNVANFNRCTILLATALDLDEQIAQFLVSLGINSLEDLVSYDKSGLVRTGIFTEEIATELINRAISYLENQETRDLAIAADLNIPDDVMKLDGITPQIAIQLHKHGNVKTVEQIADLSTDEMIDILTKPELSEKYAQIILAARKIAY